MIINLSAISPINFHGLRIYDYTAGKSLSSSIAAIEIAPGARHAEAWSRRSDKYYLVSRGEVSFVLEGAPHVLKTGDFCFVRQGQRFSYSNQTSETATLILAHTPNFDLTAEEFVPPEA